MGYILPVILWDILNIILAIVMGIFFYYAYRNEGTGKKGALVWGVIFAVVLTISGVLMVLWDIWM